MRDDTGLERMAGLVSLYGWLFFCTYLLRVAARHKLVLSRGLRV